MFDSAKGLILNIYNKDFFNLKYTHDSVHELRHKYLLNSLKKTDIILIS